MKLGTQTGSVVNHLQSRGVIGEPRPVVGLGCTLLSWTDRNAGTIQSVEEIGGSKVVLYIITVTEDDAACISGSTHDGSAEYHYTTRPDRTPSTFRKNKKTGLWEEIFRNEVTGKWNKTGGKGIRIGERNTYRDPSF